MALEHRERRRTGDPSRPSLLAFLSPSHAPASLCMAVSYTLSLSILPPFCTHLVSTLDLHADFAVESPIVCLWAQTLAHLLWRKH